MNKDCFDLRWFLVLVVSSAFSLWSSLQAESFKTNLSTQILCNKNFSHVSKALASVIAIAQGPTNGSAGQTFFYADSFQKVALNQLFKSNGEVHFNRHSNALKIKSAGEYILSYSLSAVANDALYQDLTSFNYDIPPHPLNPVNMWLAVGINEHFVGAVPLILTHSISNAAISEITSPQLIYGAGQCAVKLSKNDKLTLQVYLNNTSGSSGTVGAALLIQSSVIAGSSGNLSNGGELSAIKIR